jgi:hypothetical protein
VHLWLDAIGTINPTGCPVPMVLAKIYSLVEALHSLIGPRKGPHLSLIFSDGHICRSPSEFANIGIGFFMQHSQQIKGSTPHNWHPVSTDQGLTKE